eukprot:1512021-Amphidinium_carterae.1
MSETAVWVKRRATEGERRPQNNFRNFHNLRAAQKSTQGDFEHVLFPAVAFCTQHGQLIFQRSLDTQVKPLFLSTPTQLERTH